MNRIGVVVFPGSNCEYDALEAMSALGAEAQFVWHSATHLDGFDGVILPGGFAHGDYLRPGALARFSPVMDAVAQFARAGGAVLGICNGFQVLTEAGLLPGALQKNRGLTFLCQPTTLIVESTKSVLTRGATVGQELVIPINHFSARTPVMTRPSPRSSPMTRSCFATRRTPMVRVTTSRASRTWRETSLV